MNMKIKAIGSKCNCGKDRVPATVRAQLSRNPTKEEIKFGHGCRIYMFETMPLTTYTKRKFLVREGVRWTIDK